VIIDDVLFLATLAAEERVIGFVHRCQKQLRKSAEFCAAD